MFRGDVSHNVYVKVEKTAYRLSILLFASILVLYM